MLATAFCLISIQCGQTFVWFIFSDHLCSVLTCQSNVTAAGVANMCCLSHNKESLFHNQTLRIHQIGVGGRTFQQAINTCGVPQPAAFVSGMCLKNALSVSSLGSAQIGEGCRNRATIEWQLWQIFSQISVAGGAFTNFCSGIVAGSVALRCLWTSCWCRLCVWVQLAALQSCSSSTENQYLATFSQHPLLKINTKKKSWLN